MHLYVSTQVDTYKFLIRDAEKIYYRLSHAQH